MLPAIHATASFLYSCSVPSGCYTQVPHMGGFQTTGLDFTQFWRLGVRPGSWRGGALVTTLFGWQTADFSPRPHMAERAGDPSGAPFIRHHPHDLTTPQSHTLTRSQAFTTTFWSVPPQTLVLMCKFHPNSPKVNSFQHQQSHLSTI